MRDKKSKWPNDKKMCEHFEGLEEDRLIKSIEIKTNGKLLTQLEKALK